MSGRHKTFTAYDNRRAKRAVKACLPVLQKRVHLGERIACGKQGCVYETTRGNKVVKVTAGTNAEDEIDFIVWLKERGWRIHTALPMPRQVYRLGRCATRAGVRGAYVTVREDLTDVPATAYTRLAVTLLERLEKALHRVPGTYHDARAARERFEARNNAGLRRIQTDPDAWRIYAHIAHLQMWLAYHGLTMGDIRLSNLGIRKPSHQHGERFDVVVRDVGFLGLRTAAPAKTRRRLEYAHERARALGTPPLDEA